MYLAIVVICVLTACLTTVTAELSYTKESISVTGKACMSDCIRNRCLTGWSSSTNETCIPGTTPALKYHSAGRYNKYFCVSRCGKFEEDYNWCYVSDTEWDYCDPFLSNIVTTTAFTHNHGPCRDTCAYNGETYLWCRTHWGGILHPWDRCDQQKYSYIQSKTIYGKDCIGKCGRQEADYNWCYDKDEHSNTCAPPPRDVSEFEKLKSVVDRLPSSKKNKRCPSSAGVSRRTKRYFDICEPVADGFVEGYAQTFERRDNGLLTVNLQDATNPIYRYTTVPRAYNDEPELPLVVRARITQDTLRQRGAQRAALRPEVRRNLELLGLNRERLDNNNDEIGHLVGHQNGGPNEIYNLAPQTRRLNRDCTHDPVCQQQSVWYWTEMDINSFVRSNVGAEVEMTIVVVYRDLRSYTRPDGFAVNLAMYYQAAAGRLLHHECNDYYFSNDPESDSN